jgi:hypothetical protein
LVNLTVVQLTPFDISMSINCSQMGQIQQK